MSHHSYVLPCGIMLTWLRSNHLCLMTSPIAETFVWLPNIWIARKDTWLYCGRRSSCNRFMKYLVR
ncbi:MAG: hypothetical protein HW388_337 [Dehalococcoidia bacterium]|nr:hypothetical protein [Dehalococcoidia bacterium]